MAKLTDKERERFALARDVAERYLKNETEFGTDEVLLSWAADVCDRVLIEREEGDREIDGTVLRELALDAVPIWGATTMGLMAAAPILALYRCGEVSLRVSWEWDRSKETPVGLANGLLYELAYELAHEAKDATDENR